MPACHAGDRGFDSRQARHFLGSIAQSVEQRTENPRVGGSIPSRATILKEYIQFYKLANKHLSLLWRVFLYDVE